MACKFKTKKSLEDVILPIVRRLMKKPKLAPTDDLGASPGGWSPTARGAFYYPIRDVVEGSGCMLRTFSPPSCEKSATVNDIVAKVASDLKIKK